MPDGQYGQGKCRDIKTDKNGAMKAGGFVKQKNEIHQISYRAG